MEVQISMRRLSLIYFSILFAFFATNNAFAQRQTTILSNGWKFIKQNVDVMSSTEKWEDVTVPHTWNAIDGQAGGGPVLDAYQNPVQAAEAQKLSRNQQTQSDDVRMKSGYYRGTCWYARNLDIPSDWKGKKRVFVRFQAASQVAKTFINKNLLGEHRGAFTAFTYELTDFLNYGQPNELRLEVDNSQRQDMAPLSGDFNMWGGIYRPVELIVTDVVCVSPLYFSTSGVFLTTKSLDNNKAVVDVKSYISNGRKPKGAKNYSEKVIVETQIIDKDGKTVATAQNETAVDFETTNTLVQTVTIPNPHRWQGRKDAYLYHAKVRVLKNGELIDEITQPLGLRTTAITQEKGFLLNGEVYPVYGVCRHQDKRDKGWAINADDEIQDNKNILEIGATAVRNAHYPQSQSWHNLADSAGLLMWDEVTVVNETRTTRAFWENTNEQLRELCYQLYNHPSVVWWGIFNELGNAPTPPADPQLAVLRDIAKSIDSSRIVVGATNQYGRKFNTIPDQIGFNIYPGWYFGDWDKEDGNTPENNYFEKYVNDRSRELGKRIAFAEYGAGGDVKHHIEGQPKKPNPAHGGPFHPEEWQTFVHEKDWAVIKDNPKMWGSFLWAINDFAAANRNEGSMPAINTKGLITHDRKIKKDAFYFYKANWNPEPMVYISSRRATQRKQQLTDIKVFSNIGQVELRVNGKSYGKIAPDSIKICLWKNVQLIPGKNKIEVKAISGKKKLVDTCEWVLIK